MTNAPTNDRHGDSMTLDDALKLAGVVGTGGQAKRLVQSGEVKVNGEVETRRKRKVRAGDIIEVVGESFVLELATTDAATTDEPG